MMHENAVNFLKQVCQKRDKFNKVYASPTWDLQNSQQEKNENHESDNSD